jgi:hypothetical protein
MRHAQTPGPQTQTHSGRRDPVPVSQPNHSRALDSRMAICDSDGVCARTGVEQAELLVSAGLHPSARRLNRPWKDDAHRRKSRADGVPAQALNRVSMTLQRDRRVLAVLDIPETDEVIARCRCQDVGCGRVEDDLADFTVRSLADNSLHSPA